MSGLVYNQVWEDYAVDQQGLAVGPGDTALLIASGGCNALNTALEGPSRVVCVDANPAQIALLRDKMQTIAEGSATALWDRFGAPAQRRSRSIYAQGAYGNFRFVQMFFRMACGEDRLERFLSADSLASQERLYLDEIEPRIWRPLVRAVPSVCVALFGVHWRQLAGALQAGQRTLQQLCAVRLRRVLTRFPIRDNYYWYQMLHGSYADPGRAPPYLNPAHFDALRGALPRIEVHVAEIGAFLNRRAAGEFTRVNLLDLPDFLDSASRRALYRALARVVAPGARILTRSFVPGSIPPIEADDFALDVAESDRLTERERTASYGRVTLLRRRR